MDNFVEIHRCLLRHWERPPIAEYIFPPFDLEIALPQDNFEG